VAAASSDDMQMVKLYPEGNAEVRFKLRGVRRIFFYCNRDGLFSIDPVKGIDDKEKAGYKVHVISDCVTSYDLKKLDEMFAYYGSKGCDVKKLGDYTDGGNTI
jgi:hypothetical protein